MQHLKSSNPHDFVVLFVYVFMHALPGIVDGARKTSQSGRWVRVGARETRCRFSALPMLEATTSRNQFIIVPSMITAQVWVYLYWKRVSG